MEKLFLDLMNVLVILSSMLTPRDVIMQAPLPVLVPQLVLLLLPQPPLLQPLLLKPPPAALVQHLVDSLPQMDVPDGITVLMVNPAAASINAPKDNYLIQPPLDALLQLM
jgi:hypothetical protein